jgi:dCMP deaminase
LRKIIIAYVPILHRGYIELFDRHKDVDTIGVLDRTVTSSFRELVKDVRALDAETISDFIRTLGIGCDVSVFSDDVLRDISKTSCEIVMANDLLSKLIAKKYFGNRRIIFESVFLRWDRESSQETVGLNPDHVSNDRTDVYMMELAERVSFNSSDWWRRVGAVFVKEGRVLLTSYNRHLPTEHTPYVDGDPRASFKRGEGIEISTAIHAEASLIGEAARGGTSLLQGTLYVTTFPCQTCAKLVSVSGIKKLCYRSGYAVLDGERVLKDAGIRIVFVPK